jgi:hypothetical protein
VHVDIVPTVSKNALWIAAHEVGIASAREADSLADAGVDEAFDAGGAATEDDALDVGALASRRSGVHLVRSAGAPKTKARQATIRRSRIAEA